MNKTIAAVTVAIATAVLHPTFPIAEPAVAESYEALVELRKQQERRLVKELEDVGWLNPKYDMEIIGAISTSIIALDSMIAREERELYRLKERDFFAPTQQ